MNLRRDTESWVITKRVPIKFVLVTHSSTFTWRYPNISVFYLSTKDYDKLYSLATLKFLYKYTKKQNHTDIKKSSINRFCLKSGNFGFNGKHAELDSRTTTCFFS